MSLRSRQQRLLTQRHPHDYQRMRDLTAVLSLVGSKNAPAVLPRLLQTICEYTGWELSTLWLVNHASNTLRAQTTWHQPALDADAFDAQNRSTAFESGVGLPGGVWATRQPAWIADIRNAPNFPRAEIAGAAGIHSAFAFPIEGRLSFIGVIEVLTQTPQEPDEHLLALMAELGKTVGAFIDAKNEEAHTQEQKNLHQALLQSTTEGVVGLTPKGYCSFANQAAARMLGYEVPDLIDLHWPSAIQRHPFTMPSESADDDERLFSVQKFSDQTFWRQDGSSFPVEYTASPMLNDAGHMGTVLTFQDLTARKQVEARLEELAHCDPLTGLPNRRLLMVLLRKALARAARTGRQAALLFLDLDRFKLINDTFGHTLADELLKEVAGRLLAAVRTGDTVARLGGDEFTIIIEDLTNQTLAGEIADRILKALAPPVALGPHTTFVAASVGVAMFPNDTADVEDLIACADTAMYAAKERRGTVAFYSANMRAQTTERHALETSLRYALDRQELSLVYQPVIDVQQGRIVSLEALLRWRHPERGLVSPNTFIPLAEENGMIVPIGEWALQTACRQLRAWHQMGFPRLRLAVNLSRRQFQEQNLFELIKALLKESELPADTLELELTERLLFESSGRTMDALQNLHALGLRLLIDDFGTGYSSLSYLKHFPLDALKIDQSFVRNIGSSEKDAAIIKTIITLAQHLGLRVIAEGTETVLQATFLKEQRCYEMQGYFFGLPLEAQAVPPQLPASFSLLP